MAQAPPSPRMHAKEVWALMALTSLNVHRLLLAGLVTAAKFHLDEKRENGAMTASPHVTLRPAPERG
eukprot:gene31676-14494_t